ncbi:hypothetical protein [Parasphingorhabdus sp.]|uniref:hypothetical protein n=1 Tax=Parasphingorhabdus sp. TaxID=2709688 RepID=UPI003002F8F4
MGRIQTSLIVLGSVPLLSGCVAALLPLAALGALGKNQIDRTEAKRGLVAAGAVDLAMPIGTVTVGTGDESAGAAAGAKRAFTTQGSPAGAMAVEMDAEAADYLSQFFEPAGAGRSPYAGFGAYALAQSARLQEGEGVRSVVLIPQVDIFRPKTMACEGKPLAVLIDLDGASGGNWLAADTLYRQNGLIEVLDSLRSAEISVIWLSDQPVAASRKISAILSDAGLSQSQTDDFLFLDRGGEDRKQERRWDAARNYCIVAMAGDDRSDFDELYSYLRDPDGAITLENMFGNGWFLTPPPLVEATEATVSEPNEKEG